MKTLTAFVTAIVVQFITLSSASAGSLGPYVVELAGTYSTVTVTGSTAADVKTVVKPLNKAAICDLLKLEPNKHVLVLASNIVVLVNKMSGDVVARFMSFGTTYQTGNDVKGGIAFSVSFFEDSSSVGSFVGKFKFDASNNFFILSGKFQGATNNPPVIIGGGGSNSLFFQGKLIYVKPYGAGI